MTLLTQRQQYDQICKKVLANRWILANILKGCANEFKEYSISQIAQEFIAGPPEIGTSPVYGDLITGLQNEDNTENDGIISFDIKFMVHAPAVNGIINLIINIEAQNVFRPGYPLVKRGIYYGSRLISSQHGTIFSRSHYESICKVYSVWICTRPSAQWRNTITEYKFTENNIHGNAHEKNENYDLISVIIIGLGQRRKKEISTKPIIDLLRILLIDKLAQAERRQKLEKEFGIHHTPEFDKEVEKMCNLSEGIMVDGFRKGRREGKKVGIAEGRAEGIAEGRAKGRAEINQLTAYLLSNKRYADLERSTKDPDFQDQLIKEIFPDLAV